ncbi:hypothetical protein FB451DRAFT_1563193 [Mycena latifolia]|nr:hypothetical protein FB451DRAFT_1563193 [Mycena latifolia]
MPAFRLIDSLYSEIPGLFAIVVSWVLATALLAWLFSTRILNHPASEDAFFKGALVAVEKVAATKHDVDGSVLPQSSLYGLTISSLANTVIPITVPLLMGLFSFLVAADWLHAQESGHTNALPTAPQYGMMVHMFSSAGVKTVYGYAAFFRRPPTAVAQPVAAIKKCFSALLVLSVGVQLRIYPNQHPLSGQFLQPCPRLRDTLCPGPFTAAGETTLVSPGTGCNCQTLRAIAAGSGAADLDSLGSSDPTLFGQGVTTMRGQYSTNQVYLVGDLAFVSWPNITSTLEDAVFETLALKSQCQPAEVFTGPGTGGYVCSAFSPAYEYDYSGINIGLNIDFRRFNVADGTLLNESYPLSSHAITPYRAGKVLGSTRVKLSNIPSQSFTLVSDPVLADFSTTSALTPALETRASLNTMLMDFLGETFQYTDVSDEDAFLAAFNRNLSTAALSLASPLVLTQPITNGSFVDLESASRYEWAPLFFFTGLLYIYGLGALILSIITAELLKLRLTDPMVLITDQFVDGKDTAARWSVQKSALGMYQAAGDDSPPTRLGAGLVESEHAGAQMLRRDA